MTFDIIGLCQRKPDPEILFAALLAAGPELLAEVPDGQPLRLRRPDGRQLLTVAEPVFVAVPGEAHRLLGLAENLPPLWWVESRAPDGDPGAEAAGRAFTSALVAATGGLSWSSR
ncbi:hypothetical protein [Amycolatopsis sp. cg13]|uniref:hypothetical protein n=1 Tax=Amycolatopsis sp. cg13 TaxID=3238807 RepID=UPI00352605C9